MRPGLRTLLNGLIDYAGLFPPAGLTMPAAVGEFARHRAGDRAFALGRFICPVSRLREFSDHGRMLMPGTYATSGYREMAGPGMHEPWDVSALIDIELGDAIAEIDAFNEHHARDDHGLAKVSTVELKIAAASDIDDAVEGIPESLRPFFEIPLDRDCRGMVAALAGQDGLAAKVRCGGITPGLIPSSASLAGFIAACVAAAVPFKATAGLHHPIRGPQPLTYEPSPPRAVMHGFVNVFVAAALARAGRADAALIERILDETDPAALTLSAAGAAWRDVSIDLSALADARDRFALSYGSCSFTEPFDDLERLGWL